MSEFLVRATARRVYAWSHRRLPFEPRGPALEFRTALREAIAGLLPVGYLRCVYASADRTFCDTENVLLYNVGMATFGRLLATGLVFERSFDLPAPATDELYAHFHSYATSAADALQHWTTPRVVSSWQTTLPLKRSSPAAWWLAVSKAGAVTEGDLDGQPFGLRIRVAAETLPIHSTLKAMLDGTIAAFHSDPTPSALAVERLRAQLGGSERDVVSILGNEGPLGARSGLVRAYREGVQWNPADDLCVACSVVVDARLRQGSIEGELLQVARA